MKLNSQPAFSDYFNKTEEIFGNKFISNLITLQIFQKINAHLHINVPEFLEKLRSKLQVYISV